MKTLLALVLVLGLGLAQSTACTGLTPLCPAAAAGAGGSGGSAGGAGSSNCAAGTGGGPTTCPVLTARQACFHAFCQADGSGTPFCDCFKRGYELGPAPDCLCLTVSAADTAAYCQQAADNGVDASALDCSVLTSSVATACVGVK